MKTQDESPPGWFSGVILETGGRKFLNGSGPVPAEAMFVAKFPDAYDVSAKRAWAARVFSPVKAAMRKAGINLNSVRLTYATHHHPRKYTASEVNLGKEMFRQELESVAPKYVVCLGADALKQVVGTSYRWDDVHGAWFTPDSITDCTFQVFATYTPEQIQADMKWDVFLERDMGRIASMISGNPMQPPACERRTISTPREIAEFRKSLLAGDGPVRIALDFVQRSIAA